MLICPICHTALTFDQKTYICQNRHSYDIGKGGYINLHVVQHKRSHTSGDTALSVQARRRFLAQGFYAPLKDKICDIIKELCIDRLLDIGCGEGYYTSGLANVAGQVIGLDIAKTAIQTASKTHKMANITWVVGTGVHLPVADGCMDMCTSFFSPLPKSEMLRVLKSGGYLLVATPAPMHLYAMRQRLFDNVNEHHPTKFINALAPEFDLIGEYNVDTDFILDGDGILDLMHMTPYAYKAKIDKKQELSSLLSLNVGANFKIYLLKKL